MVDAMHRMHAQIAVQDERMLQMQQQNHMLQESLAALQARSVANSTSTIASLIGRSLRVFDGTRDKLVVNEWLQRMKTDLEICMPGSMETEKVVVASRYLEKDAGLFWAARPDRERAELIAGGWGAFESFIRKSFEPPQAHLMARTTLYQLKQGRMSVAEFEQRLRVVALSVENVSDDELNTIFTLGLKDKFRLEVARQDTRTLADSLKAALAAEQVSKLGGGGDAGMMRGSPYTHSANSGTAPMDLGIVQKLPSARTNSMGKNGSRVRCYNCQEYGHIKPKCPKRNKRSTGGPPEQEN